MTPNQPSHTGQSYLYTTFIYNTFTPSPPGRIILRYNSMMNSGYLIPKMCHFDETLNYLDFFLINEQYSLPKEIVMEPSSIVQEE